MSSNENLYVPILRAKMGEFDALAGLCRQDTDIAFIKPLLEPMPTDTLTSPIDSLRRTAYNVMSCWNAPMYADLRRYPEPNAAGGRHPLEIFLSEAKVHQLTVTPVTGLARSKAYQDSIRKWLAPSHRFSDGVCIRLSLQDLLTKGIENQLNSLIAELSITYEATDLLIDCGYLNDGHVPYDHVMDNVPFIRKWRRLILAGGSAPKDLIHISVGAIVKEPRREWIAWRRLHAATLNAGRIPSFADYAVRYPEFSEEAVELPGYIARSASASLRYTYDDSFLILRGQAVSRGGNVQFIGQCGILASMSEYYGPSFSEGDAMIWERNQTLISGKSNNPGNYQTWITATVNHHITLTLNQIASLV